MPNDADRAGTPAGVFGAELRFYRTRADLSQKDLAARATVSHDVISKIETGERPPAEDFPPRLDVVPELDTRGALTRLWDHLNKGHKQRRYGWFQQWAGIEAQATVLRWYEPLVVPGLLQTEDYARAILSARPDGNLDDLDEQVAARLARQAILGRTGAPQLWCILDEGVLHRAIGGSKVMRSQLHHLADVAEHPKTTIQVIRSGGAHAGRSCHQRESTFWSRIVVAASRARVATAMASSMSSPAGPGLLLLGYSKLFRARRILPNDRKTRTVAPNWAVTTSCTARCPPRLVARRPCASSRLAALLRRAS